jgi:hypothetical protein
MAKKNYIAIVRDHSSSMTSFRRNAAKDYNDNISALKEAALNEKQDTIVSTILCGDGRAYSANLVSREVVNSNVQVLREIAQNEYLTTGGSTPLFDSVGEAISVLKCVPDANDPDVSFLVMVITDGEENSSKKWNGHTISEELRRLQATDKWTFAFRVPRGYGRNLERLGIPGGNILEWDQTERGFEQATRTTRDAINTYYSGRSAGMTKSTTFYTNLAEVTTKDLKIACKDVQDEVTIWKVGPQTELVREFCEKKSKKPFLKGAAFYELVKTEPKVQDYKQIAIEDRQTGAVFVGPAARQMLGLPNYGTVKVAIGDNSKYNVYIQSTSVNRKLTPHTKVLYWPKVGVPYIEGQSAPWGR